MTQSTNINPLTGEPIGTYSKSEPFADFSDWKGEPILSEDPAIKQAAMDAASEDAAIAKALQEAKEAMKEKQAAPAVKSVKAKLVKPKAAKKATKAAGRVVGISADENKFLQALLSTVASDSNYATIVKDAAYSKLVARYNK